MGPKLPQHSPKTAQLATILTTEAPPSQRLIGSNMNPRWPHVPMWGLIKLYDGSASVMKTTRP